MSTEENKAIIRHLFDWTFDKANQAQQRLAELTHIYNRTIEPNSG